MTKHQIVVQEVEREIPACDVFHISQNKDGRSIWVKIGVAFVNKDGSINAFWTFSP